MLISKVLQNWYGIWNWTEEKKAKEIIFRPISSARVEWNWTNLFLRKADFVTMKNNKSLTHQVVGAFGFPNKCDYSTYTNFNNVGKLRSDLRIWAVGNEFRYFHGQSNFVAWQSFFPHFPKLCSKYGNTIIIIVCI